MFLTVCPVCRDLASSGRCQPTADEDLRAVGAAQDLELGDIGLPERIDHVDNGDAAAYSADPDGG
jgi:hypothetical protein